VLQESVAALATVGLKHVEVTFDSSDAAVMIDAIRNRPPQVFVEAGTMKSVDQVHQAEAGAQLVVSPHANIALAEASQSWIGLCARSVHTDGGDDCLELETSHSSSYSLSPPSDPRSCNSFVDRAQRFLYW
jgi:hypothetical protein